MEKGWLGGMRTGERGGPNEEPPCVCTQPHSPPLPSTQLQLVHLEFEHYLPDASGAIPGIDFARSLVTAADNHRVEELLNRVDTLEQVRTSAVVG